MADQNQTPDQDQLRREMEQSVAGAKANPVLGGDGTVAVAPTPAPAAAPPQEPVAAPSPAIPAAPAQPAPAAPEAAPASPLANAGPVPTFTGSAVPDAPPGPAPVTPVIQGGEPAPVVMPEPPSIRPTWWNTVEQNARTAGVDPEVLWKIAGAESNFGQNLKAKTSSASGTFQITGQTWDGIAVAHPDLGLTNVMDPEQQARAAPFHLRALSDSLKAQLGRQPTPTELYLGWFAGIGAAPKVLKADPNTPISQVLSPLQIASNPGVFNKVRTTGDLIQWSAQKMDDAGYTSPLRPAPKLDLTQYLAPGKDPSHVTGLGYDMQTRLSNMISDMPPELQSQIKINSGFRSPERQAQIMSDKIGSTLGTTDRAAWDADVKSMGPEAAGQKWHDQLRSAGITAWVGLPGGSNHQHGNAVDLNIKDPGPLQTWVHQHAAQYGLNFPMANEPWHIEPAGVRAPNVNLATSTPQQTNSWVDQRRLEDKQAQDAYSTSQATWETLKHESAVNYMFDAMGTPKPDPSYSITPDDLKADKRLATIPPSYQADLLQSKSQAEYEYRLSNLNDTLDYQKRVGAMGMKGAAMQTVAGVLDPAGWLAAGALAPLGIGEAMAGYKLGRIARALGTGAEVAAGNTLADIPRAYQDPTYEREQMAYTAAGGFLFGTGLGSILGKVHPELEAPIKSMQDSSRSMQADIENRLNGSTAGAMATPGHVEPMRGDVYDFTSDAFKNEVAQKSALGWARMDASGMGKNSENPLISALSGRMVEDAVGNADKSVAVDRAVSVEATKLRMEKEVVLAREYKATTDDYRQRNGISWLQWQNGEEQKFRQSTLDFIDNTDESLTSQYDPAVQKFAQSNQEFYKSYLELAQNPGQLDGTVRGPVRGTAEIPPNEQYVPRIWDFDKFGEYARRFGDDQMTRALTDSIASKLDDVPYDQVQKVGKAYYKALRNVQAGMETSTSNTLSGQSMETLRAFLRQESDLGDGEINTIVQRLGYHKSTEGTIARTKMRQGLDPHFTTHLTDPRTGEVVPLQLKDLHERDSLKVAQMYNRNMSAQVALARVRVEDPNWHPGATIKRTVEETVPIKNEDGSQGFKTVSKEIEEPASERNRYLIDGIRGPSDWDKIRKQVFAVGDHLGHSKAQTEKEFSRLQFLYDSINGSVHATDKGKVGAFMRTLRNLNFMRVMNQVGFAQIADLGVMTSEVGLKTALANMPALRQMMRDIKTGKMADHEMRELEDIAHPGTDWIRSASHMHVDDFGNTMRNEGFWTAAENLSQRGTRITSAISGMAPINAYIQRWASKAAVAKFVGAAAREDGKGLNVARMRVLGLSDDEQKGILEQIRKHRGTFTDEETGRVHNTLNLEKWDPALRHAFEYSIFSWTRKMIQENDLGQMNTVLGSSVGKMLAQFRMFMFAGYTKNTLHNIHMHDWTALSNVLASSVLAAGPFAAQRYLQSIGRSDQQEFLNKEMTPGRIAAAAFGRAGYSSIAPMLLDLGAGALGQDPLIDTRVTGSPSQGLISNPTMSLFDSAYRASRGIAKAVTGQQPLSQSTVRSTISLAPFSNFLPFVMMSNALMSGLPEKNGQ